MATDSGGAPALIGALGVVLAAVAAGWWSRKTQRDTGLTALSAARITAETADVTGLRDLVIQLLNETGEQRVEIRALQKEIDACRTDHRGCEARCARLEGLVEHGQVELERLRGEIEKGGR